MFCQIEMPRKLHLSYSLDRHLIRKLTDLLASGTKKMQSPASVQQIILKPEENKKGSIKLFEQSP